MTWGNVTVAYTVCGVIGVRDIVSLAFQVCMHVQTHNVPTFVSCLIRVSPLSGKLAMGTL